MLKWETVRRAPVALHRHQGAATLDTSTNVAYFSSAHCVYAYHIKHDKWTQLPECPREQYGLAVINRLLTAVGGVKNTSDRPLNTLVSLREGKWVEQFPPMPSERTRPAVVTTEDQKYVIVAGGKTVEILECRYLQWSKVRDLPEVLYGVTAVVGDGSIVCFGETATHYVCRVDSLLSSSTRVTAGQDTHSHNDRVESSPQDVWKRLPPLTVSNSCSVVICGQLLAVGGVDTVYDSTAFVPNYDPETAVYQLNRATNSWLVIGCDMLSAREGCLGLALPARDQLLVAGGRGTVSATSSTVELGTVCGTVVEEV